MKPCAIIIAAHDSADFIIDCVDSVLRQNAIPGWKIDIRIGVDGCPRTGERLRRAKIKHYFSRQNVGAYIMRNSLIYHAPADAYAYFDADDVMCPDYLPVSLAAINKTGIILTGKYQTDHAMKIIKTSGAEKGGAMTFTHEVLEKLGGFYGVRCAADTDFMHRARMAGHEPYMINTPLYYRRRHSRSLTQAPKTGMGSPYRKKIWKEMTEKRQAGIIKIVPTVIKLEVR